MPSSTRAAPIHPYPSGLDLCRVFVGCLPDDVDEDELWGLADSYGKVVDLKLLPKRGNSLGLGRGSAPTLDYPNRP